MCRTIVSVVATGSRGIAMHTDHEVGRRLRRGEIAQRTGCNIETIRYYEKIGILAEPSRKANGYRAYDEADVQRLRFILRARELGFGVDEIRGLLQLVDAQQQTCAEVKQRTELHLADVRSKIADLRRIERVLARTAAACSGADVPECPILEALGS
jgi:MerR family transcriptional regulator, mercuric resistance operon regulatory protein